MRMSPELLPAFLARSHMRLPACSPALTLSVPMKPSTSVVTAVSAVTTLIPALRARLMALLSALDEFARQDDGVRPARDRVLDQLDLLVDVGLRGGPEEPDLEAVVAAGLARPGEHRLPERRVRRLDDHVDLLAGGLASAAAAARARRSAGRTPADDADHQCDEHDDGDQRQRELHSTLAHVSPTLSPLCLTASRELPRSEETFSGTAGTVGKRVLAVKRIRLLDSHAYTSRRR